MENNQGLLAKLSIKSDRKILLPVLSFIKQIAIDFGFDEDNAHNLMLVADEACLNVIKHAYKDEMDAFYDITVEKRNGRFVIGVEDKGLPFDFDSELKDKTKGFGITIMKNFTDEIKFINLGHNGKRTELIKKIPVMSSEKYDIKQTNGENKSSQTDTSNIPIEIRLMQMDDYFKFEQLVYKTYGYTYPEFVYFRDRIKELIEKGMLISTVAVTDSGDIAGHAGVEKPFKNSTVAEIGMLMVDPLYRDRHLGGKLLLEAINNAKEIGILGLYSEAVTVHGYSQKAIIDTGGKETGVMLGFIHKELAFKNIKDEQCARQSAVMFYSRLNQETERSVYLPREHSNIIKRIYDYGGFNRLYKKLNLEELKYETQSVIDVSIKTDFNIAQLDIIYFGCDIEKALTIHLRELRLHKIDVIYLNVPLSNPNAQHFNKAIESLGFIFSGIVPEYKDGDILRYQYLNNVNLNMESTVIVSDFGKELFDYVLKYYK